MSDAFTDMARDAERGDAIGKYLETLLCYLKKETDAKTLSTAAEKADSVRGGWGGRPDFTGKKHQALVAQLLDGDEAAWMKFLPAILDPKLFESFKAISPFKDRAFVEVNYSGGDPTISGPGLVALLANALAKLELGRSQYGDKFMLTLPTDAFAEAVLIVPPKEK